MNSDIFAMKGKPVERLESCRVCDEQTGEVIADVDYWNIKKTRLVRCLKCNHIQLDPMLSDSESAKGCHAYYLEESLRTTANEQMSNCLRNFRRGVMFGYSLRRKKISPRSVLELGPGLGYFSAGLKFVFPDIDVSVMDINAEMTSFNEAHHNFRSILGVPDTFRPEFIGKFDLVIARDVIEHVTEISAVLSNINKYLVTGGYFHFITPNGYEDAWRSYLTSLFTNASSELLINHVNYYDGKGLRKLLLHKGFIPVDYYTFKIKTTLGGLGWRKNKKLMSPVSVRKDADLLIRENARDVSCKGLVREKILDKWYISDKAKWITAAYSLYQHYSLIRVNPGLNIGHEIYGLFKKSQCISN